MKFYKYLIELTQQDRDSEISSKKIGDNDFINGITRESFGDLAAQGKLKEMEKHIKDGIKKHGVLKMQDALRNELMEEYQKAKKAGNQKIISNLKLAEQLINKLFKRDL